MSKFWVPCYQRDNIGKAISWPWQARGPHLSFTPMCFHENQAQQEGNFYFAFILFYFKLLED